MPPKKKGAAAKAKESTPARSTRATDPIIVNKNGKEVEATAAATRPRRESNVSLPAGSTPAANKTATSTPATKKRGRPSKTAVEEGPPAKRGRKASTAQTAQETTKKRGPGRPPKKSTAAKVATTSTATTSTGKKRGRPSKTAPPADGEEEDDNDDNEAAVEEEEAEIEEQAPPKKRGRPPKKQAPAVPEQETAPPKRRGRPPKGGETTKIDADDDAAAEQLEEELQDTAEEPQASNSKRKAPASKKGKGAKGKAPVAAEEEDEANEASTGKNYWLMKAEQEDRDEILENGDRVNVKFTIDDLRAKTEPEPWDGVRNPTAAKNMREMKKGDLAFFYASGGKSGRKPGIVGIMEIVKEHEPDQTAWDPNAYGYVKDEKARGRWCVVHVEYRKKLTKPVHLSELQKYGKDRGALSNMQELNAARLSVSRVTEKEWDFITELIEGYEEDAKDVPAPTELNNDATGGTTEATTNDAVIDGAAPPSKDDALPNAAPTVVMTAEAVPTTDGLISDATSATSRPASRGGSRQASLAPPAASSSRPGSRAGRGRSKTPNPPVPMATMVAEEEATVSAALAAVVEDES